MSVNHATEGMVEKVKGGGKLTLNLVMETQRVSIGYESIKGYQCEYVLDYEIPNAETVSMCNPRRFPSHDRYKCKLKYRVSVCQEYPYI